MSRNILNDQYIGTVIDIIIRKRKTKTKYFSSFYVINIDGHPCVNNDVRFSFTPHKDDR